MPATVIVSGNSSPRRRARGESVVRPEQPARATLRSSPAVNAPSWVIGAISTVAPRGFRPRKVLLPVRSIQTTAGSLGAGSVGMLMHKSSHGPRLDSARLLLPGADGGPWPGVWGRAPVAQGIEHRSPKAGVAGSNPARRTECLCRSEAMTVPLAPRVRGLWRASSVSYTHLTLPTI